MGHLVTLATCSLNQWALDFEGNAQRILQSIKEAKDGGASLRIGPERMSLPRSRVQKSGFATSVEITGYGCLDHFLESDTDLHAWETLVMILSHPVAQDILLDLGLPVRHKNVLYNARLLACNKRILLIRPKLSLANDGNYREMRYFSPWKGERIVEDFYLPRMLQALSGQRTCRIGDALISTLDTCLGTETCEELFTPISPGLGAGLDGCEIFSNSSGSHHELRKLNTRLELIKSETLKSGGIYLYANQQGCDGDRLYYDGSAMIIVNGKPVAQGSQFSLKDVETVIATVDLEEVRSYRSQKSRALQATKAPSYERIEVNWSLSREFDARLKPSSFIEIHYHTPEEEIALGPACWLWDYLRRSRQAGFFLPLSGGIDSCATAVIVYREVHSMCRLVYKDICEGKNPQVIKDLLSIVGEPSDSDWKPTSPQDVASRLFHTAYLGMAENSSKDTRSRAMTLAKDIGAYHLNLDIDSVYYAVTTLFTTVTSYVPKYKMYGGTPASNLALQNIQARLRMVLSYLFAQLLPTVRGRNENNPENKNPGGLLVLGSANVDESLRGYLTKYDCSSADLNPIGSISKNDLKSFILYAATEFDLKILPEFISAPPTAELEPITADYIQSDEQDMGMSYNELSIYGRMRKVNKLGPRLLHEWGDRLSPTQVGEKVRWFFWNYAINRHKMTTLTPSYHAEQYSPDDNRFDLRPFLYPSWFGFKKIEERLAAMGEDATKVPQLEGKKDA